MHTHSVQRDPKMVVNQYTLQEFDINASLMFQDKYTANKKKHEHAIVFMSVLVD